MNKLAIVVAALCLSACEGTAPLEEVEDGSGAVPAHGGVGGGAAATIEVVAVPAAAPVVSSGPTQGPSSGPSSGQADAGGTGGTGGGTASGTGGGTAGGTGGGTTGGTGGGTTGGTGGGTTGGTGGGVGGGAGGGTTGGTGGGVGGGAGGGTAGGTGGGVGGGAGGGTAGGIGGGTGGGGAPDACPAPNGIVFQGKKRFVYGANWAWRSWAADFGGVAAWSTGGVSTAQGPISASMAELKASGASVIRWWMFPRLVSNSIQWGPDNAPSGIGGTLVADIHAALALAEQHDLYLMLTPFSFDNFRPTTTEGGAYSRGMSAMVSDPVLRQKLINNLVKPIAEAVQSSPFRHRMMSWDIINEPEWAMTGPNPNGGEAYTPQSNLVPVTHAQMLALVNEAAAVIKQYNPGALVSVGGAGMKWGTAWKTANIDFYQLHYYDWLYQYYPYAQHTLASVGLTDKPVIMGEFPSTGVSAIPSVGLPARSGPEFATDMWNHGYAGALGWAYNDSAFPWNPAAVKTFSDLHPCEAKY